jgi:hypothetical protein
MHSTTCRRSMRTSLNAYMAGLAGSDTLICLTAIPLYSMMIHECDITWVSNVHTVITKVLFPLSRLAQAYSIYVLAGVAYNQCVVQTHLNDLVLFNLGRTRCPSDSYCCCRRWRRHCAPGGRRVRSRVHAHTRVYRALFCKLSVARHAQFVLFFVCALYTAPHAFELEAFTCRHPRQPHVHVQRLRPTAFRA